MVAHILHLTGLNVGLTTTDGIYINGDLYEPGDRAGPGSAKVILKHPAVEAAVLETARGGILREGLGFRTCDVGAVLNVQADHLGLGGVNTLDDLANVKSLVVEVVDPAGVSVLNADDPLTAQMRAVAKGRIIYFSMQGNSESPTFLREHIAGGGAAVVLQPGVKGDIVTIYDGDLCAPLFWSYEAPATLGGRAAFNVANALAATAIAYGLKIPLNKIKQGLCTFDSSYGQNPGRLNVYDELPFRVIVDYGHNPPAIKRVTELVAQLRPQYHRTIGVISGVDDRREEDIREMGSVAAKVVDELIIKEDEHLRKLERGRTAALVREGAVEGGLPESAVRVILSEPEAIDYALQTAQSGDLLVIFADRVPQAWAQITSFKSQRRELDGKTK
jgi:cyanophycin synthetase